MHLQSHLILSTRIISSPSVLTERHSTFKTLSLLNMRVLIVGGGIGGLCLANGLRKAGIDAQVFERQATPFENLAGFGLHLDSHGRKALQNCLGRDSWERFEALSTAAGTTMTFRDTGFRLLAERDDATLTGKSVCETERRGIGRLELREILLQGLTSGSSPAVHWGKALAHYERLQNGRVRVHFADGTSEEGDILVGADGSRSKVREQYLPHIQREDLGIVAIAGRYILSKQRMRELPTGLTNGSLNNIVPDGKGWMFVSSWHSRPSDDGKEADHYVVWAYVIPKEDAPANVRSFSPAQLRDLAMAGTVGWSPSLTTLIRDVDLSTVGPVPLRCMPHLEPWASSNVTLVGDSIHNMPPTGM
jgi:2-polyprenyl-6-methoxyphenol hydroxylase-like FAD-dependent oxidoreductase